MKWKPSVKILPDPEIPWFVELRFPYHAEIISALKDLPGAQYIPTSKSWLVAVDLVPSVTQVFQEFGYDIKDTRTSASPPAAPKAIPPSSRYR